MFIVFLANYSNPAFFIMITDRLMADQFQYDSKLFGHISSSPNKDIDRVDMLNKFFSFLEDADRVVFFGDNSDDPRKRVSPKLWIRTKDDCVFISAKLFLNFNPFCRAVSGKDSIFENVRSIMIKNNKDLIVEILTTFSPEIAPLVSKDIEKPSHINVSTNIPFSLKFLPDQSFIRDKVSSFFVSLNQQEQKEISLKENTNRPWVYLISCGSDREITLEQFISACNNEYHKNDMNLNMRNLQSICELYHIHLAHDHKSHKH